MLFVGMIIAAVIAAFVASDAAKRGMSPVGWFFGVFLLLIVFLPLYIIVRRPLLPQYQPQLPPQYIIRAEGSLRFCSACGAPNAIVGSFCSHCGRRLV